MREGEALSFAVVLALLITMAAHLEDKGASVLDFTGFAQKFDGIDDIINILVICCLILH